MHSDCKVSRSGYFNVDPTHKAYLRVSKTRQCFIFLSCSLQGIPYCAYNIGLHSKRSYYCLSLLLFQEFSRTILRLKTIIFPCFSFLWTNVFHWLSYKQGKIKVSQYSIRHWCSPYWQIMQPVLSWNHEPQSLKSGTSI